MFNGEGRKIMYLIFSWIVVYSFCLAIYLFKYGDSQLSEKVIMITAIGLLILVVIVVEHILFWLVGKIDVVISKFKFKKRKK